jgi:hypothetical protein
MSSTVCIVCFEHAIAWFALSGLSCSGKDVTAVGIVFFAYQIVEALAIGAGGTWSTH